MTPAKSHAVTPLDSLPDERITAAVAFLRGLAVREGGASAWMPMRCPEQRAVIDSLNAGLVDVSIDPDGAGFTVYRGSRLEDQ